MFVCQDLATHTRVNPAARQASLVKLCQSINQSREARAELEKWGLSIDEKLMDVSNILWTDLIYKFVQMFFFV